MTPFKTPAGEILSLRLPKEALKYARIRPMPRSDVLDWGDPNEMSLHAEDCIKLPKGNWQILGPIIRKYVAHHEDPIGHYELEFGFDPTPFIPESTFRGKLKETALYKEWARKEMLKLIESQGEILWSNPIEKPEVGRDKKYDSHDTSGKSIAWHEAWHARRKLWQSYEAKRVKENELILNLINR